VYDHTQGKYQRNSVEKVSSLAPATNAERRIRDRHAFIATAEVVEAKSNARLATRTIDLGQGGCFVDMLIPFETGTKVQVRIHKDSAQLQVNGTVTYSQTGLGMGIAFDELDIEQERTLSSWLGEEVSDTLQVAKPATEPQQTEIPENPETAILARLVRLMVSKGLLTVEEASSLFEDAPIF
jgi:hypothetical protein